MKLFKRRNMIADVILPDGTVGKMELLAPTVKEHNKIATQTNILFDRVQSTPVGDPDPLTPKEIKFVLSTLPKEAEYRHDPESGWGFYDF